MLDRVLVPKLEELFNNEIEQFKLNVLFLTMSNMKDVNEEKASIRT